MNELNLILNGSMKKRALFAFILIIAFAYLTVFSIINFGGMQRFVTTDAYTDMSVSKLMWEQKTFFPQNWVFGNQYYIVATPALAALFYGLTGSMNTAMALATAVMTILITVSFAWMLKPFLNPLFVLTAVCGLYASTLSSTIRADYLSQLLFLMASYYACYLITCFIVLGDYTRSLFCGQRRSIVCLALGMVLSFCTGMQSVRQFAILIMPLAVAEFLRFLRFRCFRSAGEKYCLEPLYRVMAVAFANIAGMIVIRLMDVPHTEIFGSLSMRSVSEYGDGLVISFRTFLRTFRGSYMEFCDHPRWFVNLFCFFSVAAVACTVFLIIKKVLKEKHVSDGLAALILIHALSVALLMIGNVFVDIALRDVYLFLWLPLWILSTVYVLRAAKGEARTLLMAFFLLLIFANLLISYYNPVKQVLQNEPTPEMQLGEYLVEHGYAYLYGAFGYSTAASAAAADGKIIAGLWHEEAFHILEYINIQNIYGEAENRAAAYLIREEELETAQRLAAEKGIKLTYIRSLGTYAGLYTASGQLLYK